MIEFARDILDKNESPTGKFLVQVKDDTMTKDQNELRCERCVLDMQCYYLCDDCEDFTYWR